MPELPDVELDRRYLGETSLHRRIEGVRVPDERILERTSPQALGNLLKGRSLERTRRHGKYLFAAPESGGWLALHFGMTGELKAWSSGDEPEYAVAVLDFEDGGHLAVISKRMLGFVGTADDPEALVREKGLGPDALDGVDADRFVELYHDRRDGIKSGLMNQDVMAGVGNEYSDEILFHHGLHPESDVKALDEDDLRELHATMHHVLHEAVEKRIDPKRLPHYLLFHREPGADCPKRGCGGTLEKLEVNGRPTYVCPKHQKKREV